MFCYIECNAHSAHTETRARTHYRMNGNSDFLQLPRSQPGIIVTQLLAPDIHSPVRSELDTSLTVLSGNYEANIIKV